VAELGARVLLFDGDLAQANLDLLLAFLALGPVTCCAARSR